MVNWVSSPSGSTPTASRPSGLWLVFTYLWLPFMILPSMRDSSGSPARCSKLRPISGGVRCRRSRACPPLAFPAIVAGSIFTFWLTLGDYIAPGLITSEQFIGTVIYGVRGAALPVAAAFSMVPIVVVTVYLLVARSCGPSSAVRAPDGRDTFTRFLRRLGELVTLAFIYLPLVLIALYAFNENVSQAWPIEHFSTKWFAVAYHDDAVRGALRTSVLAALGATAVALVLGTLASLAVSRYRFFGREAISFPVILPIALPGIVTGLALQATILDVLGPLGLRFSIWTIIIGHGTFCIVVIYNNAVARIRRLSRGLAGPGGVDGSWC